MPLLCEGVRQWFLCGLALAYLFAFISFYVQFPGLQGRNGITPITLKRNDLKTPSLKIIAYFKNSLFRSEMADTLIELFSAFGVLFSVLAFLTKHFRDCMAFTVLWVLYLSLMQIGNVFMHFQWDTLLLECGFLAIIIAPLDIRKTFEFRSRPHDRLTMFLAKWLLFRLMFASGVVKLQSGCPTWWGLTALNYHYESQCIPTPLAWHAHHFPEWFQKLSVVGTYVIEIILPFLVFVPTAFCRKLGALAQIFLMVVIAASGNYNFFNFLTAVLSFACLEDCDLPSRFLPYRSWKKDSHSAVLRFFEILFNVFIVAFIAYWTVNLFSLRVGDGKILSKIIFNFNDFEVFTEKATYAAVYIAMFMLMFESIYAFYCCFVPSRSFISLVWSCLQVLFFVVVSFSMFYVSVISLTPLTPNVRPIVPKQLRDAHRFMSNYHIVNSYGLFRHMTGVGGRPELVIEGSFSENGPWKEIEFMYKPGAVDYALPWSAPYQPRLDWQMWFAALGNIEYNPWLHGLMNGILNNQPEVLDLLDRSRYPFIKKPPKYVRGKLYRYSYTKPNSKHWWSRTFARDYYQPTSAAQLKERFGTLTVKRTPSGSVLERWLLYLRSSSKVPGEQVCWAIGISLVAIKIGNIFTAKLPLLCL